MIPNFGQRFDDRIGLASERTGRWIDRRAALRTAVVGAVAGIGAVALGQRPALAQPRCSQGVSCGPTPSCNYQTFCGGGSSGCPSGYSLCKSSGPCYRHHNEQNEPCAYSAGYWVACTGCNGNGSYKLCLDCVGPGGCTEWCTCISPCL